MTGRAYFWDPRKKRVIETEGLLFSADAERLGLLGHECVDAGEKDTELRYGMFSNIVGAGRTAEWDHIPVNELDPEFRTWLLLEGVG